MPILDLAELEGVRDPELIFGLVAPVGTPLKHLSHVLADALTAHGYTCETIRMSEYLRGFNLPTPEAGPGESEYRRLDRLMTRGNELRERMGGGEALALLAAADIRARRPQAPPHVLPARSFILRQLKHPDEVVWLRTIYGPAFHLVGIYCPEPVRKSCLKVVEGFHEEEAEQLIARDKGEESRFGQQVTQTFHRSDVFVELRGYDQASAEAARAQLERYLSLLFGKGIITPTREEYGMFLAHSAALRSADLSRQVGAAILTARGEVVSLGANEVPRAGGGQYWGGGLDARDFRRGGDANAEIKREVLEEVVAALTPEWDRMEQPARRGLLEKASRRLGGSRLMNLTEFGRAVHAEMEAILAASRIGVSPAGNELYTTTFPCHNCAKHIVDAGLSRVLFIEPYPKSLADRLHHDAIAFPEDAQAEGKVVFEPFIGVAPRMYSTLFSSLTPEGKRVPRKTPSGNVNAGPVGLRVRASHLSHIDREAVVALAMRGLVEQLSTGETTHDLEE